MTRCRIHIEAPPQRVFEVLSRGERYADWVVGARAIRDVDDGFPAPGTSLHHSFGVAPLVVRDQTRVVRVEPPRLLQLEAHAGKLAATVRFELVPDATGTTVVMDEEGADGPSRVVAGMTRVLIAGRNAETLWRLREQVLVDEDTDRPMPSEARSPVEVPRWLGDLTARAFGLAAAVRFPRPLHPSGVTRAGEARLTGRGRLLAGGPTCRVVARFSRGAGLPEPLPDVLGLAVRFVDAFGPGRHHDVLLSSGGPGRLAWVLAPAREAGGARFSSILRYRLDDADVWYRGEVRGHGFTLARLGEPEPVEVALSAQHGDGTQEALAELTLDEVVDGREVRFDPSGPYGGAVPLGWLNALREPAYAASQAVVSR